MLNASMMVDEAEDPCPERAMACRALASIGAPPCALEAARRVDIVESGLSPLDWARIVIGSARGVEAGTWGWAALVLGS